MVWLLRVPAEPNVIPLVRLTTVIDGGVVSVARSVKVWVNSSQHPAGGTRLSNRPKVAQFLAADLSVSVVLNGAGCHLADSFCLVPAYKTQSSGLPDLGQPSWVVSMNFFLHVLGIDNVSGRWYAFWSGFGANLGCLSVFTVLYRKHNCHVRSCWRIGHFVEGGFVYCRKHHGG